MPAEDYVSSLANTMGEPYLREHLLSGATRVWEWDEGQVRELLEGFTADKSRVMVMAKAFKDDSGWKNETWYNSEYRVIRMDEGLLKEVRIRLKRGECTAHLHAAARRKNRMTFRNFSCLAQMRLCPLI